MILDGKNLKVEEVVKMARNPQLKVEINSVIEDRVKASRALDT